tara:strand:- start:246 stop:680 length:435 start_codon:yes stop_codon:yes gene_type:complete
MEKRRFIKTSQGEYIKENEFYETRIVELNQSRYGEYFFKDEKDCNRFDELIEKTLNDIKHQIINQKYINSYIKNIVRNLSLEDFNQFLLGIEQMSELANADSTWYQSDVNRNGISYWSSKGTQGDDDEKEKLMDKLISPSEIEE